VCVLFTNPVVCQRAEDTAGGGTGRSARQRGCEHTGRYEWAEPWNGHYAHGGQELSPGASYGADRGTGGSSGGVVDHLAVIADESWLDSMGQSGETVMAQVAAARDGAKQVADNFTTAMQKSIDKNPIATLGMVAAVAFVLGAIWRA
jgi:hypothetical protein